MPDLTMFVIRHGQTDYNRDARLQGSRDIALNDTGRTQAAQNGRSLASLPAFDAELFDWVASPLGRTRETMELVRAHAGLAPGAYRTDPLLIELSFGDWEGSTLAELEARTPGLIRNRDLDKWDFRPPGDRAESYEMMARRIDAFLKTVTLPTVCVAHGGTIRAIFNRIGRISGQEAAMMDVPQDQILAIAGDRLHWI